jgi:hypothetical protein
MKALRNLVLGCLLVGAVVALSGCATDGTENVSSRPWGYVRGYDPGLPTNMNDGR